MEDGIIATTTTDMAVDPQIATTITEAICTPVEITTVIVLDMAVKIMVIMGEAYSTIITHLEACLEEEGILLHWYRPCPFIQILSRFYPDFLKTHFIQILS